MLPGIVSATCTRSIIAGVLRRPTGPKTSKELHILKNTTLLEINHRSPRYSFSKGKRCSQISQSLSRRVIRVFFFPEISISNEALFMKLCAQTPGTLLHGAIMNIHAKSGAYTSLRHRVLTTPNPPKNLHYIISWSFLIKKSY